MRIYQNATETEFVLFRLLGYSIARIFVSSLFLLYIHICVLHVIYTRLKEIPHLRHGFAKKVLLIDSY